MVGDLSLEGKVLEKQVLVQVRCMLDYRHEFSLPEEMVSGRSEEDRHYGNAIITKRGSYFCSNWCRYAFEE